MMWQEELKKRAELARERAKMKAQKDEQEKNSRAVAGVNHLDIPAELAFIFNKLDGEKNFAITGHYKVYTVSPHKLHNGSLDQTEKNKVQSVFNPS